MVEKKLSDVDLLKSQSSSDEESGDDAPDDEFNIQSGSEEQEESDVSNDDSEDVSNDESENEEEENYRNIGEDENDGDESSNSEDEESVNEKQSDLIQKTLDQKNNEENSLKMIGEDEKENQSDESTESESEKGNIGWADAMAKVLSVGKNSEKKVSILSKAKKDNVAKKKTEGTGDDTEELVTESPKDKKVESWAAIKSKKKEIDSIGRRKPDIKDKSNEKILSKIATRGVVQLFNAVKDHQKSVKTQLNEAGKSFRKREKVYKNIDKNKFLEVLSGKPTPSDEPPSKKVKIKSEMKKETSLEEDQDGKWNILRDDFMLGAKMRDWDKQSDEEIE